MKTNLIKCIATTVLCLMANNAWSVCDWTGKVVRLRTGALGNFVDIAGHTGFPNTFASFAVPSAAYYSLLGSAQAGHVTVIVKGNAASCLATGLPEFFNGGTLTSLDIYTNF